MKLIDFFLLPFVFSHPSSGVFKESSDFFAARINLHFQADCLCSIRKLSGYKIWIRSFKAIKNSKSDDGILAMESQLSEVLMNYAEEAEPLNETRAEMMTFAIE